MEFSSLIDVSSFFIGVLINLLLIALICFYFKRKFDNIEMAQSEQAKIIYNLIESKQKTQQIIEQDEPSNGLSFFNSGDLDKISAEETKDVVITSMVTDERDKASHIVENDTDTESESEDEDEDDVTVNTESDEDVDENITTVNEENKELSDTQETTENDVKTVDISGHNEESIEETYIFEKNDDVVENEDQVDPEDGPEEIIQEYEKMTVKELREALNAKGYHVRSNMKKSEMIDILQTPAEEPTIVVQEEEEASMELKGDEVIEVEE